MTGILFPDFARSFGAGEALRQNEQQNAFQMDRARRADEADALDRETGQHFGAAIQGDKGAQARVMTNPKYALPLLQYLDKADSGARARLKEQFEATGKAAAGILALPDADQPAAYEAIYQQLTQQGYKINLPPRWSPALKGQLQSYAVQVPEYLKMLGDQPQPMGAPGGFTGQVAKDESGGNYNIPNAKGSGAYGKYQFMPETWASVAQANPQLNLPMNMRQATPQQQEAAMEAFTRSNGQALTQAGQPATPANLYLAHRFGVGGASKFLSASDDTPIAALFPPIWIQQNPDLNTTVGQFKRSVQGRYGGIPAGREVDIANNAAPMPQPPGGMAVPGTPAQMPGGPPGLAQGSDMPAADANGTPLPPQAPQQEVFEINSWLSKAMPGAKPMGIKGKPVRDSQGLLMILKPDGTTGWVDVPKPQQPPSGYQPNPAGGLQPIPGGPADKKTGGPFAGTGMDAQSMNILLTGDPASPEYALAFSHLSKPRTTIDDQGRPVTIQPMDLSAVRKPAGVAAAPAPAGGGTTTALPGGGTVTVGDAVAPKGPSAKEISDLRTARTEAQTIITALEDFRKEFTNADPVTRGKSALGMTTGLNTAYNVSALLAKGEALFNLGVLNGPDLDIIRRTLPDPSTLKGAGTNPNDMSAAVDKVINILNTRLSSKEKQLGITPEATGGAKPGQTYMGPDNRPISWNEIEATAKNRGITPDEVIGKLGLKPDGAPR